VTGDQANALTAIAIGAYAVLEALWRLA